MGRHPHFRRRPARAQLLDIALVVVACGLVPLLCLNVPAAALDDLDSEGWSRADSTPHCTTTRPISIGTSPYDERAFGTEIMRLESHSDRPYVYCPLLAIAFTPLTQLSPREAAAWFCAYLVIPIGSTVLTIATLQALLVSTISWVGTLTLLILLCAAVNAAVLLWREKSILWPSTVAVVSVLAVGSCRVMETCAMSGSAAGPLPAWLLSMPMYGIIVLWLSTGSLIVSGLMRAAVLATTHS
jgi:hypothetical protein